MALSFAGLFPPTLVLYHGAHGFTRLEDEVRPSPLKKMAWGPGFYLTTGLATARKYAKGGGRVLRVELDPSIVLLGTRATVTTRFDLGELLAFVATLPRKKKEIAADLRRVEERAREHGTSGIFAEALVNLAHNHGALAGEAGPLIARFYVAHGVDGAVEHSRGYAGNEDWIILWNMRKVRSWRFLERGEEPPDSPRILAGYGPTR